ncbi:MAG: MBL fold metallo-hydrolase [Actinomycetes bacterium]|jgi:flavorubredoxin
MAFEPKPPTIHLDPEQIAPDTFVIRSVQQALGAPLYVHINSMVIKGKEPIIIDTGTRANRTKWLSDVFSLVEPEDVRWVFVSHEDIDHIGNLEQVMTACPNATLVLDWGIAERYASAFDFPVERCRWVEHNESFDIGDRTLKVLRPPIFDSPSTHGVFDTSTGALWAVDTFAAGIPDPTMDLHELDHDEWIGGMGIGAFDGVAAWLPYVDPVKFNQAIDRVADLKPSVIASAHSPALRDTLIDQAFEQLRRLPFMEAPLPPGQSVLDEIIAATSVAPE